MLLGLLSLLELIKAAPLPQDSNPLNRILNQWPFLGSVSPLSQVNPFNPFSAPKSPASLGATPTPWPGPSVFDRLTPTTNSNQLASSQIISPQVSQIGNTGHVTTLNEGYSNPNPFAGSPYFPMTDFPAAVISQPKSEPNISPLDPNINNQLAQNLVPSTNQLAPVSAETNFINNPEVLGTASALPITNQSPLDIRPHLPNQPTAPPLGGSAPVSLREPFLPPLSALIPQQGFRSSLNDGVPFLPPTINPQEVANKISPNTALGITPTNQQRSTGQLAPALARSDPVNFGNP